VRFARPWHQLKLAKAVTSSNGCVSFDRAIGEESERNQFPFSAAGNVQGLPRFSPAVQFRGSDLQKKVARIRALAARRRPFREKFV
jgi:hypothetical protein